MLLTAQLLYSAAMPRYRYHVATTAYSPLPVPDSLPSIMAASPGEAATLLAAQGRLPVAGDGLYLRLIADRGTVTVVSLMPEFDLPINELAPDDSE